MKISGLKLEEIKKEIENKKSYLKNELEEGVKRGGPMDSFKEAAAVSANLQAHNQKLKELENILNDAEELPEYVPGDEIILGKWFMLDFGKEIRRMRLVESIEADASVGLLSVESPLGQNLISKKQGEMINFNGQSIVIIEIE